MGGIFTIKKMAHFAGHFCFDNAPLSVNVDSIRQTRFQHFPISKGAITGIRSGGLLPRMAKRRPEIFPAFSGPNGRRHHLT
ncbi:hypothetical protein ADJ79_10110 [Ottowia sp. oral taxon 894]|nr:hypothetical protein ADJ79_10110 [Ottowia sp. oral taxon 894]